jgi:hypothetical protein
MRLVSIEAAGNSLRKLPAPDAAMILIEVPAETAESRLPEHSG